MKSPVVGMTLFVTLDDEAAADIQVNCTEGATDPNDGTKAYTNGQSYMPYSPLSIFDTDTLSRHVGTHYCRLLPG